MKQTTHLQSWWMALKQQKRPPVKEKPLQNTSKIWLLHKSQHFKDELLSNSTNRCNLIKDVSKNMTKKILVNQQERINAMQKFKNGKSADEYGITAEHIKFAGKEISFCRFLDICA